MSKPMFGLGKEKPDFPYNVLFMKSKGTNFA